MNKRYWAESFAKIAVPSGEAILLALASLASLPLARADSFNCYNNPDAPHCKFSDDSPGPLSTSAADRARQGQSEIGNINTSGASGINASPLGVCSTAQCTPAQRAAAIANATAIRAATTAATQLVQEKTERSKIIEHVDAGVPARYTAAEASAFHEMFQGKTPPTKEQINSLHPDLRDAGTAMRTSMGSEKFLANAIEKNRDVAKKTGELLAKDENLLARAKSFPDLNFASKIKSANNEKSESGASQAPDATAAAKIKSPASSKADGDAGNVGNEGNVGMLGNLGKELKPVGAEDKTLIGQMIVNLRDNLQLSKEDGEAKGEKNGEGSASSNSAKAGENGNGEAGRGEAGHGESGKNGKTAEGESGKGEKASAHAANFDGRGLASDKGVASNKMDLDASELSIFERVHLRIASRAVQDGLFELKQGTQR